MTTFRRIYANDPLYKFYSQKFKEELKRFEKFLKKESNFPKSGKPSSYRSYLTKFLVHLKEIFDVDVTQFETLQTVKQIERLTKLPHFVEFNKETKGFYNATLSDFKRYIQKIAEINEEEQIDQDINERLQKSLVIIDEDKLVRTPTKRKQKQDLKGTKSYPRSEIEMMKAKENSGWKCEISSSHETFINEKINKPFVEGHHLIPMFAQDQFEYTIDFADNIVTLCPNCHRKIHYGLPEDKFEMIRLLYQKRKNLYPKYGINITLKELLLFYDIDEKEFI